MEHSDTEPWIRARVRQWSRGAMDHHQSSLSVSSHQWQICTILISFCEFCMCAIKMYHPIWYEMRKTLEMGQIYLLRWRLQSAFWHQVCNASNLGNYNFENHEDAATASSMHSSCLESVGQLIQNQQKMLPTHSLHLHMGKSILVSNYLTVQKVTSLYWEECRAWQSCHICHLWEDKNGCLVSFFNNIYYFAFSNFLDSSDSVAPALFSVMRDQLTSCWFLGLCTLQDLNF